MTKKLFVLIGFLLVVSVPCFAADIAVNDEVLANGSKSLTESGSGVTYTVSKPLKAGVYYSTMYKAVSSAGAPDITLQFEESYTRPTTEGASDSEYTTPVGASDIATNLVAETWQQERLLLIPNEFYRYKITFNAGDAGDTVVNIKTIEQSFNE